MNKLQQRIISITLAFTLIFSGVPAQAFGDVVDEAAGSSPAGGQVEPEAPDTTENPMSDDESAENPVTDPDGSDDEGEKDESDEVKVLENEEIKEVVSWNDGASASKPSEDAVKDWMTLYFQIEGGEYYKLPDNLGVLGLDSMPEIFIDKEDSSWTLHTKLPVQIKEGDETKDVSWTWELDDSIAENVKSVTDNVNGLTYLFREKPESASSDGYEIVFTRTSDYSAAVNWDDENNKAQARPSTDIFKNNVDIQRSVGGAEFESIDRGSLEVAEDYSLSLSEMPAFREDGKSYEYRVVANADSMSQAPAKGSYSVEYAPEGKGAIYNEGSAIFTFSSVEIIEKAHLHDVGVYWNDDKNVNKKRPEFGNEIVIGSWIKLQMQVGDGDFVDLTPENMASIGLEEMPELKAGEDEGDHWSITTEGDIPYQIKVAGKTININWKLAEVNDEVDKSTWYMHESERADGNPEFTLVSDYASTVVWLDNENSYETRPSVDQEHLVVYRYLAGSNPDSAEKYDGKLVVAYNEEKPTDPNWGLSLNKAPAFNHDGTAYVYYVEVPEDVSQDKDEGVYKETIENVSNFSADTKHLYSGGTADLLLTGEVELSFDKVWLDGVDKDHRSEIRPNCELYVWSLVDNPGEGISDLDQAYPVDSLRSIHVPGDKKEDIAVVSNGVNENDDSAEGADRDDGAVATEADSDKAVGERFEAKYADKVPKFNSAGAKYIYYAVENKSGDNAGQYITTIDNSECDYAGSAMWDDVKTTFKGHDNYILNGGEITNDRDVKSTPSATKVFRAAAMQSATAKVKYVLQKREKDSDEGWVYATKKDVYSLGPAVVDEETGNIIITIENFSGDKPSNTVNGPTVYTVKEYEPNVGSDVEYRWIETEFMMGTDGQWYDVECDNPKAETANLTYSFASGGLNAPGANGDFTTAWCKPIQISENEIHNVLVGVERVEITKEWDDENGNNITKEKVLDSKEPATAQFKVVSVNGKNKTITLGASEYDEKRDCCVKVLYLPRYDTTDVEEDGTGMRLVCNEDEDEAVKALRGIEHEWRIEEIGGTPLSVITKSVVDHKYDAGQEKIINTEAHIVNGVGETLWMDVEKRWLDEDDALSRRPVGVEIYYAGPDGNLDEPVKEATGIEASGVLDANNGYMTRISFQPVNDDTDISHYVAKEVRVGQYSTGGLGTAEEYQYAEAHKVALETKVDEGDGNALDYAYEVTVARNTDEGEESHCDYIITNRRIGELNLEMTKHWYAGGADPIGTFEVVRVDRNTDGSEKETSIAKFKLSADELDQFSGNDATVMLLESTAPEEGTHQETISVSRTVKIENLAKYDGKGYRISYRIYEREIDGKRIENDYATVGTDRYVAKTFLSREDIKTAADHHTGDWYYWTAENRRTDTVKLNSFKVWRDDGNASERPNIHFNVKRIAVPEEEYKTFATLVKGSDSGKDKVDVDKDAFYEYCVEHIGSAKPVGGDFIWDTQLNSWCWSCDIGSLPRYDDDGCHYVYFSQETTRDGSSEYKDRIAYWNGTNDQLPVHDEKVKVENTYEVLDTELSAMDPELCLLSDGSVEFETKDNTHYSRTTVNYRVGERKIVAEKDWILPDEFGVKPADMPPVDIEIYRSVKDVFGGKTYTEDKMLKAIDDKENGLEFVASDTLTTGNFKLEFDQLAKYDDYGRTYYYYLSEKPQQMPEYPLDEIEITPGDFSIKNVYKPGNENVKIHLEKQWESLVAGKTIADLVGATFEVYAQPVNAKGDPIGNRLLLDKWKVKNKDVKSSIPHDFTTCGGSDEEGGSYVFQGQPLPYYGPNHVPMKYYIKESNMPDGYVVTANGTTVSGGQMIEVALDGSNGTAEGEGGEEGDDGDPDTQNNGIATAAEDADNEGNDNAPAAATMHNGSVTYKNTYEGGKTDLEATKTWDGETGDLADILKRYRSAKIQFVVKRDSANTSYGDGKPGEFVANIVVDEASSWKGKLSDLDQFKSPNYVPKYAPNGAEYKYYVAEEHFLDKDGNNIDELVKKFYKAEPLEKDAKDNPTNINKGYKNTIDTTSFKVSKAWNSDLTADQLTQLIAYEYVPRTITFTLMHSTDGKTWTEVKKSDGTALSTTVDTISTFSANGAYKDIKTWSNLPKYELDKNEEYKEYKYAVRETIGDISWISADGNSGILPFDKTGKFKGESIEVTNNTSQATFKNKLETVGVKLRKVWDDNGNQDNTRPGEITIEVFRTDDEGKPVEFKMPRPDSGNQNTIDIILPDVLDGQDVKTLFAGTDEVPEYTFEGSSWTTEQSVDILVVKNKLNHEENNKFAKITATKNYKNEGSWTGLVRPNTVKFELGYKGGSGFVAIDDSNRAKFMKPDATIPYVQTVAIAADGTTGSVTWGSEATGKLFRYWPKADITEGQPEAIPYMVKESLYDDNGNLIAVGHISYKLGSDGKGEAAVNVVAPPDPDAYDTDVVYSPSIDNTLQTKQLSMQKIWKDGEGKVINVSGNANFSDLIAPTGPLPAKLYFQLQRKTANTDWVEEKTYERNTASMLQGTKINESVPRYNKNGEELQWRFVEVDANGAILSGTSVPGGIEFGEVADSDIYASASEDINNKVKTGSLTVQKVWDDDGNRDGKRPTSISVTLYRDNVAYKTAALNQGNNWKVEWTQLPVGQNGVNANSKYKIVESATDGYTATLKVDGEGVDLDTTVEMTDGGKKQAEITNKHDIEKVSVPVTKTWSDDFNRDGKRPSSVKVDLYKTVDNKKSLVETKEIGPEKTGGWSYTFTDLNKYDPVGKLITYSVEEQPVTWYESKVDGYDIINTHTPETTSVNVKKQWENKGLDAEQPDEIKVQLKRTYTIDDETITENAGSAVTLGKSNRWEHTWSNLPVYLDQDGAEGIKLTYSVEEVDGPGNYDLVINGSAAAGFVLSNTIKSGNLSVKKVWSDDDDRDGKRPESITVYLYRDGSTNAYKTATLDESNSWSASWADLPVYKQNGTKYQYTLAESSVADYTAKLVVDGTEVSFSSNIELEKDAGKSAVITNTHNNELTKVDGAKTWNDDDDRDGKRPEYIMVNLLADGKKIDDKKVEPDAQGKWAYSFTGLNKYRDGGVEIEYTVTEEEVGEYDDPTISGYDIVNTHTPETTNVSVEKKWDNKSTTGEQPASIKVRLMRTYTSKAGKEVTEPASDKDETLGVGNDWSYTWNNLPVYLDQAGCHGIELTYSVVEVAPGDNYDVEYKPATKTADGYSIEIDNTLKTGALSIAKVWDDDDDRDGKRPESVKVELYRNGTLYKETVLSDSNNWSDSWDNLPICTADGTAYNYTFKEIVPEDYTAKLLVDGKEVSFDTNITLSKDDAKAYSVKNVHVPERVNLDGAKTWNDDGNRDGKRPASLTINLMKKPVGSSADPVAATDDDGKAITKIITKADADAAGNTWSYSFTNLYKYEGGEELEYSVKEDVVEYYDAHHAGMNVTNDHSPELINIPVTKTWVDFDDYFGKRPDSITFYLTGTVKGEVVESEELTLTAKDADETGMWVGEFKNLHKYHPEGDLIEYDITEKWSVDSEYVVEKKYVANETDEGKLADHFEFTNTLKVYEFSFDKEGLINETCSDKPEATEKQEGVKFELLQNGAKEGTKPLTAVSDENGVVTFKDVASGTYTMTETEPSFRYLAAGPFTVTIDKEGKAVITDKDGKEIDGTIVNDHERVDLALVKTSEDGTKLANATFQLNRAMEDDEALVATMTTGSDGRIVFDGLLTGMRYKITETAAPVGSYLVTTPIFVTIEDDGTVVLEETDVKVGLEGTELTWTDPDVKVSILKVDEQDNALAGAGLQILNDEGKAIESWTSTGEAHMVETKLTAGATYTLVEVKAPEGRSFADPVEFTVPESVAGTEEVPVIKVSMTDELVPVMSIQKVNQDNKPLAGAELQIEDAKGTIYATWTSNGDPYVFTDQKLKPGTKMKLVETAAPEGYNVAKPVTFTVPDYGKTENVVMIDKKIPAGKKGKGGGLSKTGDDLNPLAAAGAAFAAALAALGAVGARRFRRRAEEM